MTAWEAKGVKAVEFKGTKSNQRVGKKLKVGTESVTKEKMFKIINRNEKKLLKIVLIFTENRFLSHDIF